MSFNRENIIWQSADGTWNRGFFEVLSSSASRFDEDYDPEWDVDYDMGRFEWVRTGLPSKNSAHREQPGGNPGVVYVLSYTEDREDKITEYDIMALRLTNPAEYAHRVAEKEQIIKDKQKNQEDTRKSALVEALRENDFFIGEEVILVVKDSNVNVRSFRGKIVKDGEWITVQGSRLQGSGYHRIYNLETHKLSSRVHDLRKGLTKR